MSEDRANPGNLWWSWLGSLFCQRRAEPTDTDQLVEVLRDAENRDLIDPETLSMIEGALQVSEMRVRDIMVPRSRMIVVEEGTDPKEFLPTIIASGHSRFPLLDEKRDQVLGILLAKDMLAYLAHDNGDQVFDIDDVLRKPVFVPDSKRLNILLREFRTSRNHMAIVVDEYGGIAGLVSIEDVIEQIVGDIDDEHDVDEEDLIRQHDRDHYTVKARTPINEFNQYFGTDFNDEEYGTIGGLALKAFGQLPRRGESVDYAGFKLTILKADRRRIRVMRVTRKSEPPESVNGTGEK